MSEAVREAEIAALRAEIKRQQKIIQALMNRAERRTSAQISDFGLFQTTILLENQVRRRTEELETALRDNERITRDLREYERERVALQEQLRYQATHDSLTGLYNRHHLTEAMERELHLARRHGYPISLVLCDLDHFKAVNDSYGHLGGDQVIQAFSALVRRKARQSDLCYRFGGEEFLLVLPRMPKDIAMERAGQLRVGLLATAIPFGGKDIFVTASFGVASFPMDGENLRELVAAADHALYEAKAGGRNQVCGFAPN
jgi:diguanylate cyclase (GGDEF)-like protein